MKVRIRHEHRGVPYTIEMETEALENIAALHGIICKIHRFIDRLLDTR